MSDAPRRAPLARLRGHEAYRVARRVLAEYLHDDLPLASAALAFYAFVSLAPLLVLAVLAAGVLLGDGSAASRVVEATRALVGDTAARALEPVLRSARGPEARGPALWVAVAGALFGATRAFAAMERALNRVWDVRPKPRGLLRAARARALAFLMVLATGAALVASLVASAALAVPRRAAEGADALGPVAWRAAELAVSTVAGAVLFALLFRYVPDARARWRVLAWGGLATSALFNVGKLAIGHYLARGSIGSFYGGAAAVVVLLFWVYYSSLVVLLGAELTQVLASRAGEGVRPARGATRAYRKPRVGDGAPAARAGSTNQARPF